LRLAGVGVSAVFELPQALAKTRMLPMHRSYFVQHAALRIVEAPDDRGHHPHIVAQARNLGNQPLQRLTCPRARFDRRSSRHLHPEAILRRMCRPYRGRKGRARSMPIRLFCAGFRAGGAARSGHGVHLCRPVAGLGGVRPHGRFVTAAVPCLYAAGARRSGGLMDDVIGKLTGAQALELVARLSRRGDSLRRAVVAEAMSLLAEVDIDETADDVFAALDSIDVEECWDRAGKSRHGYTSPDEAATELIEAEVQPFFDQVERYHRLAMPDEEARYCLGVIVGIYRWERQSETEFRQWSEDIPAECAGGLLDEWRKRNPAEAGIAAMRALIAERCPEWAKWLDRE
jgi:hypothetical protein